MTRLDLAWHELHPGFLKFIAEHNLEAALPRQLMDLPMTEGLRLRLRPDVGSEEPTERNDRARFFDGGARR